MIKRTIEPTVNELLEEKIVLLTGPRQTGKTTLAKNLVSNFEYLNFDHDEHRTVVTKKLWRRNAELVIFDELHKKPLWKRWLKGIYDTEGVRPNILVTGSARMDTYRKGGDSLAGRHHLIHLLPLSIREVDPTHADEVMAKMVKFGSFPEPFLKSSDRSARLWRKSHLDVILREDLLDLENVRNIKGLELLVDLLAERVGSTVSYASLAQSLEVSPHTVKHWIEILSSLYVIFVISPFSKNISKAILKEPKIYFYDIGRITAGEPARIENLVALHLLKRSLFLGDTLGEKSELFYIKDKEKREIDFITTIDRKPEILVEVKTADSAFSPSLIYYHDRLKPKTSVQLVAKLDRERETEARVKMMRLAPFLAGLET